MNWEKLLTELAKFLISNDTLVSIITLEDSHQSLSHVTFCDRLELYSPDSSVHGIILARILKWVTFLPPGDLPDPGIEPATPASPALQVDSILLGHWGSQKTLYTS